MNLKNIDLVTKLPNRNTLVHDINLLDTVNMISYKAQQLQDTIRDEEVSLYSLNLKEFAILIPNSLLFEKYLLLLKYSILMDNIYHINTLNEDISADFTAGIAYGIANLFNHADLVLQEAILCKIKYKHALKEANISPYFQPILDAKTAKILNYENITSASMVEFVSSQELNDIVNELGIDYIQGYYYGEQKLAQEYGLLS